MTHRRHPKNKQERLLREWYKPGKCGDEARRLLSDEDFKEPKDR